MYKVKIEWQDIRKHSPTATQSHVRIDCVRHVTNWLKGLYKNHAVCQKRCKIEP